MRLLATMDFLFSCPEVHVVVLVLPTRLVPPAIADLKLQLGTTDVGLKEVASGNLRS